MLVVDSNVVLAMILDEEQRGAVDALTTADPFWIAPDIIWYEIQNVLTGRVRRGRLTLEAARAMFRLASAMVEIVLPNTVNQDIIEIAVDCKLTFYDASYVALARELDIRLATYDQQILTGAPDVAAKPEEITA